MASTRSTAGIVSLALALAVIGLSQVIRAADERDIVVNIANAGGNRDANQAVQLSVSVSSNCPGDWLWYYEVYNSDYYDYYDWDGWGGDWDYRYFWDTNPIQEPVAVVYYLFAEGYDCSWNWYLGSDDVTVYPVPSRPDAYEDLGWVGQDSCPAGACTGSIRSRRYHVTDQWGRDAQGTVVETVAFVDSDCSAPFGAANSAPTAPLSPVGTFLDLLGKCPTAQNSPECCQGGGFNCYEDYEQTVYVNGVYLFTRTHRHWCDDSEIF